jgi:hypothetical protein
MKKIEKMFQVGGKISGRSGYRKHNIFFATPKNIFTTSHQVGPYMFGAWAAHGNN